MAITSADIHNQSFSIDRKGYDVDEVDVFLEHVADEIDAMTAQIDQLERQLDDSSFAGFDTPARIEDVPAPVAAASDEELEQWSRGLAKQERKRKNVGLKVLVVFVLLILLAFGAAVFAYTQGYGYPSQETVVKQLFADPSAAKENVIAKDVGDDKAAAMLELVPQDNDVTIDGMDKSMSDSTAYVTADLPEGGQMKYKVSLVRDMIGWKVANVDYYASSQY